MAVPLPRPRPRRATGRTATTPMTSPPEPRLDAVERDDRRRRERDRQADADARARTARRSRRGRSSRARRRRSRRRSGSRRDPLGDRPIAPAPAQEARGDRRLLGISVAMPIGLRRRGPGRRPGRRGTARGPPRGDDRALGLPGAPRGERPPASAEQPVGVHTWVGRRGTRRGRTASAARRSPSAGPGQHRVDERRLRPLEGGGDRPTRPRSCRPRPRGRRRSSGGRRRGSTTTSSTATNRRSAPPGREHRGGRVGRRLVGWSRLTARRRRRDRGPSGSTPASSRTSVIDRAATSSRAPRCAGQPTTAGRTTNPPAIARRPAMRAADVADRSRSIRPRARGEPQDAIRALRPGSGSRTGAGRRRRPVPPARRHWFGSLRKRVHVERVGDRRRPRSPARRGAALQHPRRERRGRSAGPSGAGARRGRTSRASTGGDPARNGDELHGRETRRPWRWPAGSWCESRRRRRCPESASAVAAAPADGRPRTVAATSVATAYGSTPNERMPSAGWAGFDERSRPGRSRRSRPCARHSSPIARPTRSARPSSPIAPSAMHPGTASSPRRARELAALLVRGDERRRRRRPPDRVGQLAGTWPGDATLANRKSVIPADGALASRAAHPRELPCPRTPA